MNCSSSHRTAQSFHTGNPQEPSEQSQDFNARAPQLAIDQPRVSTRETPKRIEHPRLFKWQTLKQSRSNQEFHAGDPQTVTEQPRVSAWQPFESALKEPRVSVYAAVIKQTKVSVW